VSEKVEKPLASLYLVEEKSYADKETPIFDEQFRSQKDADGKTLKKPEKIFTLEMFPLRKKQN
jgi:POT family proton-dependent oligopeptide transporter